MALFTSRRQIMEMEMMKIKNRNLGFTLVELVVALAIFGAFSISVTSVALSVVKGQRKSFALQNIQETGRYVLEAMGKEIRTGVVNSVSEDGLILNITDAKGETFDYQFDDTNNLLLRHGQAVSPSNVNLTGGFYVRQYVFPERSVVTIVMHVLSTGNKPEEQAEIYLQSTVAPRF